MGYTAAAHSRTTPVASQRTATHPRRAKRSSMNLADRRSCTELAEERARCHACDRAELGDEMRLVVVAGCGGDACPALVSVLARGA